MSRSFHTSQKLSVNDTIGIVSSARSITLDEIQDSLNIMTQWGLKVKLGKTIGLTHNIFAGTAQQRAADLQAMFEDPEVDAIWMAKGGYGSVQLLEYIDSSAFAKASKWLLGYSDITVLLSSLLRQGVACIHSSMPQSLVSKTPESLETIRTALFDGEVQFSFRPERETTLTQITAPIVGGNLSVIYSLLGSDTFPDTDGCILFIEDLDEYVYHIDRMMMNLDRNGLLRNLKGLLVGSFTDIHDNELPYGESVHEIIERIAGKYGYPIITGCPVGHIDNNHTLMLGVESTLTQKDGVVMLAQRTSMIS